MYFLLCVADSGVGFFSENTIEKAVLVSLLYVPVSLLKYTAEQSYMSLVGATCSACWCAWWVPKARMRMSVLSHKTSAQKGLVGLSY